MPAELHPLCCDCDACLGPGIPFKGTRVVATPESRVPAWRTRLHLKPEVSGLLEQLQHNRSDRIRIYQALSRAEGRS